MANISSCENCWIWKNWVIFFKNIVRKIFLIFQKILKNFYFTSNIHICRCVNFFYNRMIKRICIKDFFTINFFINFKKTFNIYSTNFFFLYVRRHSLPNNFNFFFFAFNSMGTVQLLSLSNFLYAKIFSTSYLVLNPFKGLILVFCAFYQDLDFHESCLHRWVCS